MAKPAAPADRNVAMNIALNSAIMVTPDKAASPSPDLPWSSRTFVPPKDARPRPEALTHKEIEITIAEVEGDLITTNRMLDRPDAWQIKASMTPAQFREFAMKLRNYGIVPDPATLADTPELSKKMEDSSPRSSGNVYKITHGNTWLKPPVVFARQADGSGAAAGGAMGGVGTSRAPEKLTITIVVEQAEKR